MKYNKLNVIVPKIFRKLRKEVARLSQIIWLYFRGHIRVHRIN